MNILQHAIRRIEDTVPYEVLRLVFGQQDWRSAPVSIGERILQAVIKHRVIPDCNVMAGQYMEVNTSGIPYRHYENGDVVLTIPPQMLGNRELVAVTSVTYMPYGASNLGNALGLIGNSLNPKSNYDAVGPASRVMSAVSSAPILCSARVEVISGTTVLIRDTVRTHPAYVLRCYVANDPNMNNISIRSSDRFAELVLLAAKAYIYKELYVKLDQAYLQGGQELGAIKNYHDSLADAEQMYQEFKRDVWSKVAVVNDQQTHERILRLQISPGV